MRKFWGLFLLFTSFSNAQLHCGYDFTSYLVVKIHENGKTEHIKNLRITIIDSLEQDVINTNNKYSWKENNKIMQFTENYLINKENEKEKWFFPYANESYLLTVSNTFQVENFKIKIEDLSSIYKTQILDLYAFNMYILCSSENEKQARQFGPRTNNPIEVVLEKK